MMDERRVDVVAAAIWPVGNPEASWEYAVQLAEMGDSDAVPAVDNARRYARAALEAADQWDAERGISRMQCLYLAAEEDSLMQV